MGKSLVASDIREGVDVYFNCVILANPAPRTKIVTWLHNVSNFSVLNLSFTFSGTKFVKAISIQVMFNQLELVLSCTFKKL